jgi:signal transduction histidine kinase
VTGIALNEFVSLPGNASDDPARYQSVSLQVALRTPDDMRVVKPAPYWTTERLQWLAGIVLAGLLLAAAWIALLRRQVAKQTALIKTKVARETLQEERARMARELHDTLEQQLTGLSLQLDTAGDTLGESPEVAQRALAAARGLLKHTRVEARRSIWDLRPSALEDGDLLAAMRESLSHASPGARPEIIVEASGTVRRLPAAMESGLLRIATEAVTNAVKHAQATRVNVKLTYAPDTVEMIIRDDGCGFDATAAPGSGRFGLTGMRERAARMNARLQLASQYGHGTTLTLTVPQKPTHPLPHETFPQNPPDARG